MSTGKLTNADVMWQKCKTLTACILPFITMSCLLVFFGCQSPSSSESGVIGGEIILYNETDHSGVTVLLYHENFIPAELQSLGQDYPALNNQISYNQLFDHRMNVPLKETITDTTGKFSFAAVPYGRYILAFYKPGFGFKYVYDVLLNSSFYNISAPVDNILHPVVYLPNAVQGNYEFASGVCYEATSDVDFLQNSNVLLNPGCTILIPPNKKITFWGSFAVATNEVKYSTVTSSDKIYTSNTVPLKANQVEFASEASASRVELLNVSLLTYGLIVKHSSTSIERSIFHDNDIALQVIDTQNVIVSQCAFVNQESQEPTFTIIASNEITILDNVFYNNHKALKINISTGVSVMDTYFNTGYLHVENGFQSSTIMQHNELNNSTYGVSNSGKSNLELQYNSIQADNCVWTYHTNNMYNTLNTGWTKANNNNFSAIRYAVESNALYYSAQDAYPLDFKYNYWGTASVSEIADKIFDTNDQEPTGLNWVWSVVVYDQFRQSKIINTGIH